jgi:hypothetical protein
MFAGVLLLLVAGSMLPMKSIHLLEDYGGAGSN